MQDQNAPVPASTALVKPYEGIVFNFSHKFSPADAAAYPNTVDIPVNLDVTQPFVPQVTALVDRAAQLAGWEPDDWHTKSYMVELPGLAVAAALIVTEITGRCGYPPAVIRRVRNADGSFSTAEVIILAGVRDAARTRRFTEARSIDEAAASAMKRAMEVPTGNGTPN